MNRLVGIILAENDRMVAASLAVVAFVQQYARIAKVPYDFIVAVGPNHAKIAERWLIYGAENVYLVEGPERLHTSTQSIAKASATVVPEFKSSFAGPGTRFGTEVLAAVAGTLGLPMLSSVRAVEESDNNVAFHTITGNKRNVFQVSPDGAVFSIDPTSFGAPRTVGKESVVKQVAFAPKQLEAGPVLIETAPMEEKPRDLATARVVVAGGRALGD